MPSNTLTQLEDKEEIDKNENMDIQWVPIHNYENKKVEALIFWKLGFLHVQ